MTHPLQNLFNRLFSPMVETAVREKLNVRENENAFLIGARRYDENDRDRLEYDRAEVLESCLQAWRDNPLARRIVELTTQYAVGSGFDIHCAHHSTRRFIDVFWTHRLNRMDIRMMEICDELSRTGNLFLLISTDQAGMSYLRIIPASNIDTITAAPNDIEQPISFATRMDETLGSLSYPAYDPLTDSPGSEGCFSAVMLHYAINRPAGAQWGEPDLAPLLPWLRRYSAWLEDRVRLNRFRNAFMYVVTGAFPSEAVRKARQAELAANPPGPGSILVCDASETWSVVSPKLEALDAMNDGLAIKKLIASGAGVPLHFLAEPEGSNRTTAESAGDPTIRRFEQRQQFLMWLISDVLKVAIARRGMVDRSIDPQAEIRISGADISTRDNVSHSIASVNILNTLERLRDRGLVSDRELLRIVYRFAGEAGDLDAILAAGSGVDQRGSGTAHKPVAHQQVNPATG